jgi:hypothetical protein
MLYAMVLLIAFFNQSINSHHLSLFLRSFSHRPSNQPVFFVPYFRFLRNTPKYLEFSVTEAFHRMCVEQTHELDYHDLCTKTGFDMVSSSKTSTIQKKGARKTYVSSSHHKQDSIKREQHDIF